MVVIGFGIAGGCAAVSAAAAGARVLVLERAAVAGGTTSLAGGHFYLGGGTAVQQATGHADSPEEMYKYLVAVSREPDHDKIRAYCDGSVEHFNWLEDLGFQFERSYFPGKVVVPPGTEGLMLHRQREGVAVLRAGHAGAARALRAGARRTGRRRMVIDLLVKRAADLGVQIRYETGATDLIVDDDGAVVGVHVEALHRNRCGQGQSGHHRRRRIRDEPRDGRQAHARTGPAAPSTTAVRPTSWATPTTTASASGWASRPAAPPSTWTRCSSPRRLSAGDPADRPHRQQAGQALRRRGLLPLPDLGVRAGSARPARPT